MTSVPCGVGLLPPSYHPDRFLLPRCRGHLLQAFFMRASSGTNGENGSGENRSGHSGFASQRHLVKDLVLWCDKQNSQHHFA